MMALVLGLKVGASSCGSSVQSGGRSLQEMETPNQLQLEIWERSVLVEDYSSLWILKIDENAILAGAVGLEPTPSSLTVRCPTNWTTPQPFLDCKRDWNFSSHAFFN
jgi:hypothetical protein